MVQIKCLSNGLYSLKNSHIPFGMGFQPPPYGRIPFEQHLCYTGSSLTVISYLCAVYVDDHYRHPNRDNLVGEGKKIMFSHLEYSPLRLVLSQCPLHCLCQLSVASKTKLCNPCWIVQKLWRKLPPGSTPDVEDQRWLASVLLLPFCSCCYKNNTGRERGESEPVLREASVWSVTQVDLAPPTSLQIVRCCYKPFNCEDF